jgi:hypothetical protein
MILFRNFLGFVVVAATLFACKKEMSSENTQNPIVVDAKWEFKEGGRLFQGDVDTAFISRQPTFYVLTIDGIATGDSSNNGVLLLQIGTDTITTGSYPASEVYFQYSENGSMLYESDPSDPAFSDFSITIDAIDSTSISGTFGGTVKGSDGAARTLAEGKFAAELAAGSFIPEPDPDTIPPNLDYLPLGSVWTYGSLSGIPGDFESDTVKISAAGDTTIESNVYTKFYNERTAATRYFRKDTTAGIYYEYVFPTVDFPLQAPMEQIILQENSEPNFSWESGEQVLNFTSPAISIIVKFKSTITRYNESYDIDGKIYNNVIEVTTNILINENGTFNDSGSIGTMYYAAGIGIIAYAEQTTGVGYGIRHYIVTP